MPCTAETYVRYAILKICALTDSLLIVGDSIFPTTELQVPLIVITVEAMYVRV